MRLDGALRRGVDIWYSLRLPVQILLLILVLALPVLAVWGIVGLFRGGAAPAPQAAAPAAPPARGGALEQDFATRLLEDTTRGWTAQFRSLGRTFQPAAPIFANGIAPTACDNAPAPSGLFYCTADARIYVDLDRQAKLSQGGDGGGMTVALLLAHAVGHHVQQQLGMLDLVRGLQARSPDAAGADNLRRRVELQADCFAGLWAKSSTLVTGLADTAAQEAAFAAMREDAARPASPPAATNATEPASAAVVPQAPAPLTAAERAQWFRTGMQRGDFAACDTFSGLP
ncbi:neutral zinc metallopeptidase [Roseomonas sp. 18066]|uniref:neutral zinc metallopeptidase n=1 Tax=Roseomonas sp. 18066 TaxID=2681412 RepID=UPI0013568A4D|nr:neutral zinc metallopeptidase [Roseomonas sp. 18066]